jgi:thiamine-phosphate pyrophosphorylase
VIPRLCYIGDAERGTGGRPLPEVVARLWHGGVGMVVLRAPGAPGALLSAWIEALEPLRSEGLRVLVSRRLDLARAFDLDGVHLAADAVPVSEARAWLGPGAWIGYSAHSGDEALRVEREGASYVTLSPIYPTESKPGAAGRGEAWLARATRGLRIPALALGGLRPSRVAAVLGAGAWGVAAVSALGAAPDVESAARDFAAALVEANE